MALQLRPLPGFDWNNVSWGGPDEPAALACSYCDARFGDGEMPLMMFNEKGWCAQFCEDCQARWWGVERIV